MSKTIERLTGRQRSARQMGRLQRRMVRITPADVQVRERDPDTGLPTTFTAIVLRYNVVDDYLTRFAPGCFDDSMAERMPRICWAHDWADPLGRYEQIVRNNDELLELYGVFSSFADVPSARRASSQLNDGTIDQFSVGFYITGIEDAPEDVGPMVEDITRGDFVEASPILLGAVPGTALTGMRSRRISGLMVPLDDVTATMVDLAAGNIDVIEAGNMLQAVAVDAETASEHAGDGAGGDAGAGEPEGEPAEEGGLSDEQLGAIDDAAGSSSDDGAGGADGGGDDASGGDGDEVGDGTGDGGELSELSTDDTLALLDSVL